MSSLRKLLFFFYIIIGQLAAWGLILLLGRLYIWRILFVIYPHNVREYNKLSWDWPVLRRIMDGRPVPAGIIVDGLRPIGIYFLVSNTIESFYKKQNKHVAKKIERRMKWAMTWSGAQVVGFAGGLGQTLQKKHNIKMIHPFYDSAQGNVYAITRYIRSYAGKDNVIGIIGGGPLGKLINESISLKSQVIPIKYRRRQGYILGVQEIPQCNCYVNLLPTGQDFVDLKLKIPQHAAIIDFSRPPIPQKYHDNLVLANRLCRPNTRFFPPLPGGWRGNELPACSLPALLAAYGDLSVAKNARDFDLIARYMRYQPSLKRR